MVRFKDKIINPLIYVLFLVVIGFFIIAYEPFPPDDFLRHVRHLDYQTEGGYAYMYPFSSFEKFSFNPWHGFDLMAGHLKEAIGAKNAVLVFEIFFISLFFIAVILNIRNPEEEKDWIGVYVFLTILLMTCCLERLILIRPTVLMAIVTILCLKARGSIAGLSVTVVCAFLYYLYFLFFIPLAVVHYFKGCRRFALGASAGVVASAIGWVYLTDFEYITALWLILSGLFDREGIIVSENVIFIHKLLSPIIFLIAMLFITTVLRERKFDRYLLMLILTAPLALQARYFLDLTLPMMFVYAVRNSQSLKEMLVKSSYKKTIEVVTVVSIILIFPLFSSYSIDGDNRVRLDGIDLPKGSVVFSESLAVGFATVYWNKNLVRIIPAAEVGWSGTETKSMVKKVGKGRRIDGEFCQYAQKYGITHVLTSHQVEGECLKFLSSFSKGKRVDLFKAEFGEAVR